MRKGQLGCGICIAVFIALLLMRLIGLGIPWLLVTAPLWAPPAFIGMIIAVSVLAGAVQDRIERRKRRKWH